uniref:CDGSH iron-sulfur domain-containing protein 2 n=1 Tax=Lygus hesperus TaxID=30085 RepID=A0A0A9Y1K6_LYGHE
MEPVHNLLKVQVPNYLSNLPLPNSISGWFKLSIKDWANLVPFFALVGGAGYITYRAFRPKQVCNPCFKKDDPKVVNVVNIEELGEKTAFCRCWRSAKFPYCDGAHAAHNKETGDNVGPLLITKVK